MRVCLFFVVLLVALRAPAGEPDVTGTWTVAVAIGERTVDRMLRVERGDEGLRGTWTAGRKSTPLEQIVYAEGVLKFRIDQKTPDGVIAVHFTGVLEGERLVGTLAGPHGSSEVVGERGRPLDPTIRGPKAPMRVVKKRPRYSVPGGPDAEAVTAPADRPPGSLVLRARSGTARLEGRVGRWRFVRAVLPGSDLSGVDVEIEIDLASMDGGAAEAASARMVDLFDVERHRWARLRFRGARRAEFGNYDAIAEVEFNGQVGAAAIVLRLAASSTRGLEMDAVLSRKAFAMGADVPALADDVVLELRATLPD